MKAICCFNNGEKVVTTATKRGRSWYIGGDVLKAWTDLGAKVFIDDGKSVYLLKGAVMVFQDNTGCLD